MPIVPEPKKASSLFKKGSRLQRALSFVEDVLGDQPDIPFAIPAPIAIPRGRLIRKGLQAFRKAGLNEGLLDAIKKPFVDSIMRASKPMLRRIYRAEVNAIPNTGSIFPSGSKNISKVLLGETGKEGLNPAKNALLAFGRPEKFGILDQAGSVFPHELGHELIASTGRTPHFRKSFLLGNEKSSLKKVADLFGWDLPYLEQYARKRGIGTIKNEVVAQTFAEAYNGNEAALERISKAGLRTLVDEVRPIAKLAQRSQGKNRLAEGLKSPLANTIFKK